MEIVRRFRLFALLCPLAVLICELISHPFVNMGVCDDGPYILMAKTLATTGHVVYNGWATAMLGWQLYIGAAFIRLFGYSFTTVRSSALIVSLGNVFLLQRTFVRGGITERNATVATLALVLTPLYLLLSVTYMTDIFGLFAIVLCLYSCLRALQSTTFSATLLWILFAVASNAIFGTARQIAWLGLLVLVPCTLWLIRAQTRVLIAGSFSTVAGAVFVLACTQWLKRQPYSILEHVVPATFPIAGTFWTLTHVLLEIPFILLPIVAVFLLRIHKSRPRVILIICALVLGYIFLSLYPSHLRGDFGLEPTVDDWMSTRIMFAFSRLQGAPPVLLPEWLQILLTIASLGGLLSLVATFRRSQSRLTAGFTSQVISWKCLLVIVVPFVLVYTLLLVPRATGFVLSDRYLLPLLVVALLCLTRYFQEAVQPHFPPITAMLVGFMAFYGIAFTHDSFAVDRARVALAEELHADGVSDTSFDDGWEYNLNTELQHASHINDPHIQIPANAFVAPTWHPTGTCSMTEFWRNDLPHLHSLYGASFDPTACYGLAPFAPIHYSRWPYQTPGTLYVVRYTPAPKP